MTVARRPQEPTVPIRFTNKLRQWNCILEKQSMQVAGEECNASRPEIEPWGLFLKSPENFSGSKSHS